mgnify:CR=1 FL=1
MLLQRKVDRAMKWSRERSLRAEGIDPEEEELKAELKKHSGKKDSAVYGGIDRGGETKGTGASGKG